DDDHDRPEEVVQEPKVVPLVPVEGPRIVMLHETKPTPRVEPKPVPRIVEPAATNGAPSGDSNQRTERPPAVLKGLRPPVDAPPRRRSREVPDLLRSSAAQRPPSPSDDATPPAPAWHALPRATQVEPKAPPN